MLKLDPIFVMDTPIDVSRIGGSAQVISEKELERYDYDDVNRVLMQVPGVYVRNEDGFGLRPNIGMRGASSDRSSKVTLMEDGVLFAPAPYSAPAAYYFPLMARIAGTEVYKGPASIRFGPQTVGGAINFLTRPIPTSNQGQIEIAGGQYRFGKVHGFWGTSDRYRGILLEAAHLESAGFKQLDGGGDTGFNKNEAMLKARLNTDPLAEVYHELNLKLGYGDETSHETYLGVTRDDFDRNSRRRYRSSQLDLMKWHRTQIAINHNLRVGETFELRTTAYRNDMKRVWNKLNRICSGSSDPNDPSPRSCNDPALHDILAQPDTAQHQIYLAVLRGEADSSGNNLTLMVGANNRRFVSQGVQSVGTWHVKWRGWAHDVEVGARFHFDQIRRLHTEDGYLMQQGTLVPDGSVTDITTRNRGRAFAVALHALDQISVGPFVFTPGLRAELIKTTFRDVLLDASGDRFDGVLIPGMGAVYQILPEWSALAGVFKGFSPVSPGQPRSVKPEASVNYELGSRLAIKDTRAELIGFFNDYSNLTSECSFNVGCEESLISRQFNGGNVYVYGLEASGRQNIDLSLGWMLAGQLAYTLTLSEFRSAFQSENPTLGSVEVGDHLPYVPVHQGSLQFELAKAPFRFNATTTYVGEMRDIASQGSISEAQRTDPYAILDLVGAFSPSLRDEIYVRADNVFNTGYVTSLRPFGARPGTPLLIMLGYRHRFGNL